MGKVLKPVSRISGVYGQPGEERVSQLLADSLPDNYAILNSPRLYYHGGTFDIDHVIIGPNGIFVIETKNMQGYITGGIMGNWLQERKRYSGAKNVKIGNPANQVNQYGKVVKSHLGSKYAHETAVKINIKVYPIVVFVHDDADISSMDFTKPGFVGSVRVLTIENLVDFILTREGANYNQEEIDKFAELLVPENQREQTAYFSLDKLQDLTIPDMHGRYEIFEELGRGNFGIVFRGFDYKLDKEIAIKKLPIQNQSDSNAINRFYKEAQIASSLSHENIIGVYDYYEKSGEYFIIMEMAEGETLDMYIQNHKPSVKEALSMFKDICRALDYAHQNQVIHRDLKPSNILISLDGKVKITDFGIAKLANSTGLTMENTGAGTPVIMAPEQITGGITNEQTDIFSMGVVLYFILTGKMPFNGEYLGEIVHQITHLSPVDPRRLNNQISQDLEYIVLKALEKNPEERFEKVSDLLDAVDEVLITGKLANRKDRKWLRYLPVRLRPFIGTERRLFTAITVFSIVVFMAILGVQSYRDSRQLSNGVAMTKQMGFTNENVAPMFDDPGFYTGLPANLVGRIEKVVDISANSTTFNMVIHVSKEVGEKRVLVSFSQPHFAIPVSVNVKITGSLQGFSEQGGEKLPVIIADKVEAAEEPWSFLAPAQFTVYPKSTINQKGKVVEIEKIEFASRETRLYITARNIGKSNEVIILSDAIGKQGIRQFKEIKNSYGVNNDKVFQLSPGQEVRSVVFLEPLDSKMRNARFILGSTNDVLTGQQPYTFDLSW